MIYRNQVMKPSHMSMNHILNKERKQKYKSHLAKIFQIQNRQFNPKLQAKLIDDKSQQLAKLKQFARNYKAKQQQLERFRKDCIMVERIKDIKDSTHFVVPEDIGLRKTRSTMKFNSRVISSSASSKNIAHGMAINDQVIKQNRRLIKSITQNSFDEDKFRKTLKQSTKDYIKIRSHMRRVKGERQSLKKLKTQPIQQIQHYRAHPVNLIYVSNNQQTNEQHIEEQLKRTEQTSQTSQRQKIFKKSKSKKKKIFSGSESLTRIIDKKLQLIH